jgi:predicted HicB family RNase H-like nuclease
MAIAKKPKGHQPASTAHQHDKAAEEFIHGATEHSPTAHQERRKVPIMMRFDREVLARVDRAAKRRGISRSAWIQFTVSRALDQGEG